MGELKLETEEVMVENMAAKEQQVQFLKPEIETPALLRKYEVVFGF